jgi:predicted chitinase
MTRHVDLARFFAEYRRRFGPIRSSAQVVSMSGLLGFIAEDDNIDDVRHAAYMLATVKHETNNTFAPVREAYWTSEAWRKAHLRYYPWYGRGYVQLTWEANYKRAGEAMDIDLTTDPDVAMRPEIAYAIMSNGMRFGWFTGKKLPDYINQDQTDYANARRIINGIDKAALIAGYADQLERCLGAAFFAQPAAVEAEA